jgi:hypothetical protein
VTTSDHAATRHNVPWFPKMCRFFNIDIEEIQMFMLRRLRNAI